MSAFTNPKGPCTQIVYTLGPVYNTYVGSTLRPTYTIRIHGPLGYCMGLVFLVLTTTIDRITYFSGYFPNKEPDSVGLLGYRYGFLPTPQTEEFIKHFSVHRT